MAAMSPKQRVEAFARSMMAEGILDQQFNQMLMLAENGSGPLVEMINLFCHDCERIIGEISRLLDQPAVDLQRIDSFVHQLKGSSSSVGAHNIKVACMHFRQSCEERDIHGCLRALNAAKNEYYHLKGKFNTMVQLSRGF